MAKELSAFDKLRELDRKIEKVLGVKQHPDAKAFFEAKSLELHHHILESSLAVRLEELRTQRGKHIRNKERDTFIYHEAMKGTKWLIIVYQVQKKFNEVLSIEGIKRAADRFAVRMLLPLPPKRQRGRRRDS